MGEYFDLEKATRRWDLRIRRDGQTPTDWEEFAEYFKYVIANPSYYTAAISYPESDEGITKWNGEAVKHNKYDYYLTKTDDGQIITMIDVFDSIFDAIISDNYNKNNITGFKNFIINDVFGGNVTDEGKELLKAYFSNRKNVQTMVLNHDDCENIENITVEDVSKEKETIRKDPSIIGNYLSEFAEGFKQAIISKNKITSSNTDVIIEESEVPEEIVEEHKPVFSTIINPENFEVPKGTENPEATIKALNPSEEQKELIKKLFENQYTTATSKIMNSGGFNKVSDGFKNFYTILKTIYNNPQDNVLNTKASAIMDLLQRDKHISFRDRFNIVATSSQSPMEDAKFIKLANPLGDTISYCEGEEVVYTEAGKQPYVYKLA